MAIKKQAFYEGAALHLLARTGRLTSLQYFSPFFLLNSRVMVYLKYCTRSRSPWAFTFTTDEQIQLQKAASSLPVVLGLVCGADGVAAVPYSDYLRIAVPRDVAIHIACYRDHGKYYDVKGPDGGIGGKIAPLTWQHILDE